MKSRSNRNKIPPGLQSLSILTVILCFSSLCAAIVLPEFSSPERQALATATGAVESAADRVQPLVLSTQSPTLAAKVHNHAASRLPAYGTVNFQMDDVVSQPTTTPPPFGSAPKGPNAVESSAERAKALLLSTPSPKPASLRSPAHGIVSFKMEDAVAHDTTTTAARFAAFTPLAKASSGSAESSAERAKVLALSITSPTFFETVIPKPSGPSHGKVSFRLEDVVPDQTTTSPFVPFTPAAKAPGPAESKDDAKNVRPLEEAPSPTLTGITNHASTFTPSPTRNGVADFNALNAINANNTFSSTSSASSNNGKGNSNGAPGAINIQVWAPLVGIVAVIAILVIYTCFRKNSTNASMIAATRSANDNAAGTSTTTTTTTTGTGRRRPRRTPSQVSTRSLPAYMMDPGEQEIVLARGRLRKNRSRPELGPEMEEDEYDTDMDMDMDMDEDNDEDMYDSHGRSSSQADRPLLASSASTSPTDNRLAPPARYDPGSHSRSRSGTNHSFDTMRMGSEDSRHRLLPDSGEIEDGMEADGTVYVFGEGTNGGQLYDDNEQVEMSELGGGVSVPASASELELGLGPSRRERMRRQPSQPQRATLLSPPTTSPPTRVAGPTASTGFFSSFSTLLSNSFSSIANSMSGVHAPMSGSTIGVGTGSGGGALSSANRAVTRENLSSNTSGMIGNTGRANSNTTAASISRPVLLAPPGQTLPPPYEDASRSSMETETGTRTRSRSHSRSRSSPDHSINNNNVDPASSSTLSLNASHTRNLSTSNLNASNVTGGSTASLTISAPLAHTVTRSTFTYPASGPTTEQIKFLSSREALGRFGMPYGQEAVAAAKAAARDGVSVVVDEPPPRFEDVTGTRRLSSSARSGVGAGVGVGVVAAEPIASSGELIQIISSPTSPFGSDLKSPLSATISPASASYSYSGSSSSAPTRSDSVASRSSSIRSNRSAIGGPRGPRDSSRKSTLPGEGMGVERTPRPSMDSLDSLDSIDTVDSFGIVLKRRKAAGDDTTYRGVTSESQQQEQTQQQQQRRPTLPSTLPKLTIEPALSTNKSGKPQVLPTTAPKGFVMSSPPPSPTPTTSTNPHSNPNYKHYSYGGRLHHFNSTSELGLPVIVFAPATPSGEGDSMLGHQ